MLCPKWLVTQLIFQHIFDLASRQCCDVWPSQFFFLHSFKETIPPSEACLYGHIKWSLAQCFPPMRDGKSGQRLGSVSMYKRDLCQSPVVHLWQRGLTWRVKLRLIKVAENLLVVVFLPAVLALGRRWVRADSIPDVLQAIPWSSSSSFCCADRYTSPIFGLSSEKTYGDVHSKTEEVSNLVNGPIPWNGPPKIRNFWNSTFACTVQCGCKFAINPFSISWGPFENVNFLSFLLKIVLGHNHRYMINSLK